MSVSARGDTVVPRTFSEAAAALAGAAAQGRAVRFVGGGSKLEWGCANTPASLRLHTGELDRVVVAADSASATISAGTPLARAQAILARSGAMLAIDPPLGSHGTHTATVGGVVATADGGPLSHLYGPPGAQLQAVTLALADGTVLRTGSGADQRQHGYSLTRLTAGSFGTLGLILEVEVRLHPLPAQTVSALASSDDPSQMLAAATAVAREHPGLQALDFAWHGGRGGLLAQAAGDDAAERAGRVAATLQACGLPDASVTADDAGLWARQRAGQRAWHAARHGPAGPLDGDRALLRVAHHPDELATIVRLAGATGAIAVGRAAQGIAYLTLPADQIGRVRGGLPEGSSAVVLDLAAKHRAGIDPWALSASPQAELMAMLRARLDPRGVCNPGLFDFAG